MKNNYIHGYDTKENIRLQDQASTLTDLLHSDTFYPAGSKILEAGCGIGAQTMILAKNSPDALFTSIDISEDSVKKTKEMIKSRGFSNVTVEQVDIFNLSYEPKSFDHVFVCFVLEHLSEPVKALKILKNYIHPGGTITVIEGDHGSAYFYPHSEEAHRVINCQIELQKKSGGNALIGRELYPLLIKAGFKEVKVSPRMVYVDSSKPRLVDGFTKKTFTAMIEGVRDSAINTNIIDEKSFDEGIKDLYRTAESDGVFCYTFFKAIAKK